MFKYRFVIFDIMTSRRVSRSLMETDKVEGGKITHLLEVDDDRHVLFY